MSAGGGYAPAWLWDDDGLVVEGRHVCFDEAVTSGDRVCPIHVLEVDGVERSVWVWHTALRSKIARELRKRPSGDLDPGELVRYEQLESATSETGRTYYPYATRFEHAPKLKPRDIFASDEDEDEDDGGGVEDLAIGVDDDIPF
jgi:hypothetical protein